MVNNNRVQWIVIIIGIVGILSYLFIILDGIQQNKGTDTEEIECILETLNQSVCKNCLTEEDIQNTKDHNSYLIKRLEEVKRQHKEDLTRIPTGCRGHTSIEVKPEGQYWLYCTGSMMPFFNCNETLYFCDVRRDQIKVNDIIMFENPYYKSGDSEVEYIIHQIVRIEDSGYITKGFANEYEDDFVISYDMILGKLGGIEWGE